MQAWLYSKGPLIRSSSLSPGRGKGKYALHSCLTGLDLATDPPFKCLESDTGDVALVKATHSISG
jgi:hypothetical protein